MNEKRFSKFLPGCNGLPNNFSMNGIVLFSVNETANIKNLFARLASAMELQAAGSQ